jgi:probable HAF family extracellular repeat protein
MNSSPAFLIALALALPAASQAADYRYAALDFPGAANTAIYALNGRRQMVGAEKDAAGNHHAIISDGTRLRLIDPDGVIGRATQSWAYSINSLGEIAGAYADAAGLLHGYVRRADGALEFVEFPGAKGTQAYGINDEGTVIGVYADTAGNGHAFTLRHGRYEQADLSGTLQTVPLSIDRAGDIVGEAVKTTETTGYGYVEHRDGRFTLFSDPVAPPEQTFFISINNRHAILGAWFDAAGNQFNFVLHDGRYVPFDLPAGFGATYVSAQTINDRGDIVGFDIDAAGVAHGFVAWQVDDDRPLPQD